MHSQIENYGKGGAELADISSQIEKWKTQLNGGNTSNTANYLFICCAGENDIGCGRSLDQILETFRAVIDDFFPQDKVDQRQSSRMVFLGPKFEPWLTNDNSSRKQYTKLNNGFQRAIRKHHASKRVRYIDCLTLFCTKERANLPGAVHGGKAMPNNEYFHPDCLHLNDAGYRIWKQTVEEEIAEVCKG